MALDHADLRYSHDWRGGYPRLVQWHVAIGEPPSFVDTRLPR